MGRDYYIHAGAGVLLNETEKSPGHARARIFVVARLLALGDSVDYAVVLEKYHEVLVFPARDRWVTYGRPDIDRAAVFGLHTILRHATCWASIAGSSGHTVHF